MNKIIMLFTIATLFMSGQVSAFIDPPMLEPNPAQQGEEVNLLIRMGECDGIFVDPETGPMVGVGRGATPGGSGVPMRCGVRPPGAQLAWFRQVGSGFCLLTIGFVGHTRNCDQWHSHFSGLRAGFPVPKS